MKIIISDRLFITTYNKNDIRIDLNGRSRVWFDYYEIGYKRITKINFMTHFKIYGDNLIDLFVLRIWFKNFFRYL